MVICFEFSAGPMSGLTLLTAGGVAGGLVALVAVQKVIVAMLQSVMSVLKGPTLKAKSAFSPAERSPPTLKIWPSDSLAS